MAPGIRRAALLIGMAGLTASGSDVARGQFYKPEPRPAIVRYAADAPVEVTATTSDGLRLNGLWWSAPKLDAPVLIFFHGRSGNQDEAAQYAEPLRSTGANILIASYRGYGGNPGRPSERNLLLDAKAFLELARSKVPNGRVFLIGHSLGAAVAIELAASEAETRPVDGIVTIGAFTKLRDVTPKLLGGFLRDRFDTESAIAAVQKPVVLIHAQDDSVVPVAQARKLLEAAPYQSLLIILATGDHRPDLELIGRIIALNLESGTSELARLVELAKLRNFGIYRKDPK